jgi:hypothetical protein
MSKNAKKLLLKIGQTEAALRLTKGNAKAADELKNLGLAVFISISTGGADVCLNEKGLEAFDQEVNDPTIN